MKTFLAVAGCLIVLATSACGTPEPPKPPPEGVGQDGPPANTDPMGDSCNGSFGETERDGDITVPSNASCELSNVDITGNLKLETGASLILNNTGVGGNIEGQNFSAVTLHGGRIGGNVTLIQGTSVMFENTAVNGNTELTGISEPVELTSNQIGGNLVCKENTTDPAGQDNTVSGSAEEQCQALGG